MIESFQLPQRFWDKVQKSPSCWLWRGAHNGCGHGNTFWNGRKMYAHRLMALSRGWSIAGRVVRHRCDVPACVNPNHLLVGTQLENMQDWNERGHGNRGGSNGMSRLTAAQVQCIKELVASLPRSSGGARIKKGALLPVAKHFGVCLGAIRSIVAQRRWK